MNYYIEGIEGISVNNNRPNCRPLDGCPIEAGRHILNKCVDINHAEQYRDGSIRKCFFFIDNRVFSTVSFLNCNIRRYFCLRFEGTW